MTPASKIKVLIIDDTVMYRKVLSDVLSMLPDVEVVGTAGNGKIGLDKIRQLQPDLVTLDFEMPVMDGIQTLKELKKSGSNVAVVMVSAHTREGAEVTMKALELGAYDFIAKPEGGTVAESSDILLKQLKGVIQSVNTRRILSRVNKKNHVGAAAAVGRRPASTPAVPPPAPPKINVRPGRLELVSIGISTGGPNALAEVIPKLPANFRVPVVIVQHMPPVFTAALADSLNRKSKVTVKEAEDGEVLKPGWVYIAPGGKQMRLARKAEGTKVELTNDPPENHCRPAADYLFRSISQIYENRALGVIMTGMGADGVLGLRLMKRRGASVLAQDEETCVVYGMPMEAVKAGVTDMVLPLGQIAPQIVKMVN